MTRTVDEEVCNPLKAWHDMGEPANLKEEQRALLQEAATPLLRTERTAAQGQQLTIELAAKKNGVVYFEVSRAPLKPNRGYDYQKVLEF